GLVAPGSTAEAAGIKPGDVLKELDGKPIANEAQMRIVLATKYEGDTITVKLLRDKEEVTLPNLKLLPPAAAAPMAFLGILPRRDARGGGVEFRGVSPRSRGGAGGLRGGARIMKRGAGGRPPRAFSGAGQLDEMLAGLRGGTEVKVEVKRKDGK